jgi:hypothetical protein
MVHSLMAHSSVNHIKPMNDDNPLQFVQMLIEFCGAKRTLGMPAFFGDPDLGRTSERSRRTRVSIFVARPHRWGSRRNISAHQGYSTEPPPDLSGLRAQAAGGGLDNRPRDGRKRLWSRLTVRCHDRA